MADNERDDLINGLEEITPDDIENDDRLMKLVASILVEEEKRRIAEELKSMPEKVEFSKEFEAKMQKLFRKKTAPVSIRALIGKARPYVASAAAVIVICILTLFTILNVNGLTTVSRAPSGIPGIITEPVTVILSDGGEKENFISRYSDGYYVDEKGGLAGVDDLISASAEPEMLPLYRNPIPRPFGTTAGIGLGYSELKSYSLRLADLISGSPANTPTVIDSEQTALYLITTFEGYTLKASRYGYLDLIPHDTDRYSLSEEGIRAAIDLFLEDFPVIHASAEDETLVVTKGATDREYSVYFAAKDTVRNATNRDLHEVCVTLQDGKITECRIKITDFLLEDMEITPALGLDYAISRLTSEKRFEVESAEKIAAADLVYLSGSDFEFFYPAYRFYVTLSAEEATKAGYGDEANAGISVYRLIQIPATELLYPNT